METCWDVKSFLQHPQDYGYPFHDFTTLDWPAQSPDLSPIENLWELINLEVHSCPIHSVDDLYNRIVTSWEHFQQDVCLKLVNTMPSRLREVIQRRGGHTHY